MRRIGVYEATSRLAELLDSTARGEEILITCNGKPVAQLEPIAPRAKNRAEAVEAMLEFGRQHRGALAGLSITELIEAGRRY